MPSLPPIPALSVSVVIPLFNEEATVEILIRKVLGQPGVSQVLIVDDASTDRSRAVVQTLAAEDARLSLFPHSKNAGKGAALRTALPHATGDIILIQDADLEYDPTDYAKLIAPIAADQAEVVIGCRISVGDDPFFLQSAANRIFTLLANVFLRPPLGDVHCGYKAFRRSALAGIAIREKGFGVDLELVLEAARRGARIRETPVSYRARGYAEGKKIGWRDAIRSGWVIVKYGLFPRIGLPSSGGPPPTAAARSGD